MTGVTNGESGEQCPESPSSPGGRLTTELCRPPTTTVLKAGGDARQRVIDVSRKWPRMTEVTGVTLTGEAGADPRISRPPGGPVTTEPSGSSTTTVKKARGDARQQEPPTCVLQCELVSEKVIP